MAGTRIAAVALALACAPLCPACPATDEPPPQTGTIEVEVVYKDTGEPVAGAYVSLTDPDGRLGETWVRQYAGVFFGVDPAEEPYTIKVANSLPGSWLASSVFLYRQSDAERQVTVSSPGDVVHVRFELERGREVSGTVQREDGSPLRDGVVYVGQREGEPAAFSLTDDGGAFCMYGVPDEKTLVATMCSVIGWSGAVSGTVPLDTKPISLAGESTSVDLIVASAPLDVTIDVLTPVWPFSKTRKACENTVAIWLGNHMGEEVKKGQVRIRLNELRAESDAVWGRDRYTLHFDEFIPEATLTVGTEVRVPPATGSGRPPASYLAQTWGDLRLTPKDRTIHIVLHEPYAHLSRALLFGVPPGVVLAVCIPLIVRQVRKHRRKEGTA